MNIGHEDLNGHAAQIWGFYSNFPGLLMCTHGPGLASCINAIANAKKEGHPLVILSVFEDSNEEWNFQFWETVQVLASVLQDKRQIVKITSETQIPHRTQTAFAMAAQLQSPVALLFSHTAIYPRAFFDALQTLYVGGISRRLCKKRHTLPKPGFFILDKMEPHKLKHVRKRFVEMGTVFYATTFSGRVQFREENLRFTGIVGSSTEILQKYCEECNHIIVVEASPHLYKEGPQFFSKKYGMHSLRKYSNKIINVSYDTMLSVPPPNLSELWTLPEPQNYLQEWAKVAAETYQIWTRAHPDLSCDVAIGIGEFGYALGEYICVDYPASFCASTVWGSIGIGLPNGVGLALCNKQYNRGPVFVYEGDGSLLWSSPVLHYLVQHCKQYPMLLTVFVNGGYGAVEHSAHSTTSSLHIRPPIVENTHIFTSATTYKEFVLSRPVFTEFTVCFCYVVSGMPQIATSSTHTRDFT